MSPIEVAYALIAVGIVCLVGEVFFFTGGILAGVGAVLSLIGVAMLFMHGSTQTAMLVLFSLCIGVPIVGGIFLYMWPYSPMTKKLMRVAEEDATVAEMPANLELEALVGKIGKTVSPLRPSGSVEFEGRRIDVLTEGMMVGVGQWVKCIAVRSNKVIVRLTDVPTVSTRDVTDFS